MSQLRSNELYDIGVNTTLQPDFVLTDPRMELISPSDRCVPIYVEREHQLLPSRWHPTFSAASFNPDRQMQLINQEMQRLADEMNRLWRESGGYRDTCVPVDAKQFGDFLSMMPLTAGAAHAESWRQKENFHLDNPVIKDREGRQKFRLEFDLRQFKPEEIVVTTEGNVLTVQAKHEETSQGKKARREYFRQCTIPSRVDPMTLVSHHSHSGILSVCAPLPVEEDSSMIRITQK